MKRIDFQPPETSPKVKIGSVYRIRSEYFNSEIKSFRQADYESYVTLSQGDPYV